MAGGLHLGDVQCPSQGSPFSDIMRYVQKLQCTGVKGAGGNCRCVQSEGAVKWVKTSQRCMSINCIKSDLASWPWYFTWVPDHSRFFLWMYIDWIPNFVFTSIYRYHILKSFYAHRKVLLGLKYLPKFIWENVLDLEMGKNVAAKPQHCSELETHHILLWEEWQQLVIGELDKSKRK